jgi:TrmH family RNA methyltransferase
MDAELVIRSRQNSLLKRAGAVGSGKEDDRFLLEGERLIRDALGAGVELEVVLVAEDDMGLAGDLAADGVEVRLVETGLLQQVSTLKTSPGSMALGVTPRLGSVREWTPGEGDLLLVVGPVADPGNLGALLRSAEAAGASAVVCLSGGTRPYGSKVLRGSMGSALRLPLFGGAPGETRAALEELGFRQAKAATRGGSDAASYDFSGSFALWIGGEVDDLPEEVADLEAVTVKTAGAAESLNVAVAGALLLFAAGRNQGGGDA